MATVGICEVGVVHRGIACGTGACAALYATGLRSEAGGLQRRAMALVKGAKHHGGYPAFVDGEAGAYGVGFPDLPGIVAMGETVDDALLNAEEALRDYVTETEQDGARVAEPSPIEGFWPAGAALVAVPLVRLSGRTVRAT